MPTLLKLNILKWVYYIVGILIAVFALTIRDASAFIFWILFVVGLLLISNGYITGILEGTVNYIVDGKSKSKVVKKLKS